jgi:hypothetical protein
MTKKQYILIELYEGVLGDVLVYQSAKEARKNFNQLRKGAKAGEGYCDEAHLYEIDPKSASGVSYVDSFSTWD